jgi:hypothetical protein
MAKEELVFEKYDESNYNQRMHQFGIRILIPKRMVILE